MESMNKKVKTIAELTQGFEGRKKNGIKLIKSAKIVLADYVKFQSVLRYIVDFLDRKENLKNF